MELGSPRFFSAAWEKRGLRAEAWALRPEVKGCKQRRTSKQLRKKSDFGRGTAPSFLHLL